MPRLTPRRWSLLLLLASLAACQSTPASAPAGTESGKRLLTLEQTLGQGERVDFAGTAPRYSWADDQQHLLFEEEDRKVWIDPATWEESEPVAAAESEPESYDGLAEALSAAGAPPERAKKLAARDVTQADNGGHLVKLGDERWFAQRNHVGGWALAHRLTGSEDGELELEELSPFGYRLAFVQGNDLVVVDTLSAERRELTGDGSKDVFNGKLDWVYQEEVYGRGRFKAFWWSPDGHHLAFLRLDETAVHDFTVIDHIPKGNFRVEAEVTRYPKVGDPNPVVALGVADAAAPSSVRWIDLSAWAADEPLVVRVDWAPDGRLFFQVQDRVQTWLELVEADPATGATRTLLRESSAGWVNRGESPRWLADGTFLWTSERSGQRHVYRYRGDGTLLGPVTEGDWSLVEIEDLDEATGRMWFTATIDGAVDSNLYRIGLDGRGLVRLTQGRGRHTVHWNGARTMFLDRCSSLTEPTHVSLCDGEGRVLRELGSAAVPDLEHYATSRWELLTIPARDGFELDAALLPPVDFDPAKRYPVWLPTYSGPDAPSVSNSWNASSWNRFLAQNGVMVFQVNVRSASGKGQAVTESCARRLGVQELADLEDAVDWLCAHRSADPRRIGITGASYGGFMTAFALTHSDRFALGLAASGVYDWRMYDTIYTERYMSTPERNPDGYALTSVLEAAGNLKGHLMLTHGTMDDNVHLQNVIQLAFALQKAGKDFELMLYPESRHGIGDRDLRAFDRRLTWRLIQEHLLGP